MLRNTGKGIYQYQRSEETKYLKRDRSFFREIPKIDNGTKISFLSDDLKYLIVLDSAFSHAVIDNLSAILQELESNKNLHILIDTGMIKNPDNTSLKYIQNTLANTSAEFFNSDEYDQIEINNFYYFTNYNTGLYNVELISNLASKHWSNEKPYRKVYLSRSKVEMRGIRDFKSLGLDMSNIHFYDDIRIDDEPGLENYLKNHGFEIVHPEDFPTMEEQIKFFSEVRLIASLTSAGLMNSAFMRNGGIILEFQTPLVTHEKWDNVLIERLHHYYISLAYGKKHIHVSVPHSRSAKEVINTLENNAYLKALLDE